MNYARKAAEIVWPLGEDERPLTPEERQVAFDREYIPHLIRTTRGTNPMNNCAGRRDRNPVVGFSRAKHIYPSDSDKPYVVLAERKYPGRDKVALGKIAFSHEEADKMVTALSQPKALNRINHVEAVAPVVGAAINVALGAVVIGGLGIGLVQGYHHVVSHFEHHHQTGSVEGGVQGLDSGLGDPGVRLNEAQSVRDYLAGPQESARFSGRVVLAAA